MRTTLEVEWDSVYRRRGSILVFQLTDHMEGGNSGDDSGDDRNGGLI